MRFHDLFSIKATMPLAALAIGAAVSFSADPAMAQDFSSDLMAADKSGVPEGWTSEDWMKASATATATANGDEHMVDVEATGLVPEGLYTFWWVNPGMVGMSMGPGGGAPGNDFRADADGNAEVSINVPADNDYAMMVVAYHADDETHGDEPGAMGEVTFEHLMGAWPGPEGEMSDM